MTVERALHLVASCFDLPARLWADRNPRDPRRAGYVCSLRPRRHANTGGHGHRSRWDQPRRDAGSCVPGVGRGGHHGRQERDRSEEDRNGARTVLSIGGASGAATAEVREAPPAREFSFEGDIAPVFSRKGCNNSNCHGALKGQNGFRLSVFGYEPAADFKAVSSKKTTAGA